MRLWHYELLPFLPKSQLIAQWRELNSIYSKQDKHILINYIYDYPKVCLQAYSDMVLEEMALRGYAVKSMDKYFDYFQASFPAFPLQRKSYDNPNPFPDHHNDEYLVICYYNLLEKYQRGQKDFYGEEMQALHEFCEPYIKNPYGDYGEEER